MIPAVITTNLFLRSLIFYQTCTLHKCAFWSPIFNGVAMLSIEIGRPLSTHIEGIGLMFRDKSREILRHTKYTNCQLTAAKKNHYTFLPCK